jgi:hypothetical protein
MVVINIIKKLDFNGNADKNRFSFNEFVTIMQALNSQNSNAPVTLSS